MIWYKMKWSFDYKINQFSLHGSQTVSRDAQHLGKCLQCYALYHCHVRKFLIRYMYIYSIFLTTPFAGSHFNKSIKTSEDSLIVACTNLNQTLTSWPAGNISETLETWTVEGRDVKLSDSPSFKSRPANLVNLRIWWQVVRVWLTIRKPSEFILKMPKTNLKLSFKIMYMYNVVGNGMPCCTAES